ncbi:MAG: SPFH domain-containing protein [Erysipelotrichaceae bacterium]|nr:SPFH domain-containing protein [Erysipelotrichaceae bacterium]
MTQIIELTGAGYSNVIGENAGYFSSSKFGVHAVVEPGELVGVSGSRHDAITDCMIFLVPENTAAFIYNEFGIEHVIAKPGLYEYRKEGKTGMESLMDQVMEIFNRKKEPSFNSYIGYINTREINNIKFGTHGPLTYHDIQFDLDLEIYVYGNFSIAVTEPELFIRNFVQNYHSLSLDERNVRTQLLNEFLQSFTVGMVQLSKKYQLMYNGTYTKEIAAAVLSDPNHAGNWPLEYGFEIVDVNIENIELSDRSKELIEVYMANTKERIFDPNATLIGEQIEVLKSLKELLDEGVLTKEEFEIKKKDVMGF